MVTVPVPSSNDTNAESRFVLRDVPWWTYVALRDALDESSVRMTYLDGTLELVSPSESHEEAKKVIARLLEAWAEELDVDLRGFGGATFRNEMKARGLEPDECYSLGFKPEGSPPQLAIEVIVSSPLVDKLAVYAGLGVAEVWTWHAATRTLAIRVLRGSSYAPSTRSALLPALDVELLASCVRPGESHTALVKEYRAALRGAL